MRFGKWIVVEFVESAKRPAGGWKHLWLLRCDCGREKTTDLQHLRSGRSTNCGCVKGEQCRQRNTSHGLSKHPLYRLWKGMHARCRDPNHVQYQDYGGRGIEVCRRWSGKNGFPNFVADMGERPDGASIDRKKNDRNYSPSNCCWSDQKTQCRNKRSNRLVTYKGRTECLSVWAEELKKPYSMLLYRLDHDWTPEEAFETPSRKAG